MRRLSRTCWSLRLSNEIFGCSLSCDTWHLILRFFVPIVQRTMETISKIASQMSSYIKTGTNPSFSMMRRSNRSFAWSSRSLLVKWIVLAILVSWWLFDCLMIRRAHSIVILSGPITSWWIEVQSVRSSLPYSSSSLSRLWVVMSLKFNT